MTLLWSQVGVYESMLFLLFFPKHYYLNMAQPIPTITTISTKVLRSIGIPEPSAKFEEEKVNHL
jgi:hypothetical protein